MVVSLFVVAIFYCVKKKKNSVHAVGGKTMKTMNTESDTTAIKRDEMGNESDVVMKGTIRVEEL